MTRGSLLQGVQPLQLALSAPPSPDLSARPALALFLLLSSLTIYVSGTLRGPGVSSFPWPTVYDPVPQPVLGLSLSFFLFFCTGN